jgi:hypothetical protein
MTQTQTQPVQESSTTPAAQPVAPVAPQPTDESRPNSRRTRYAIGGGIAAAVLLAYLFIDGRIARSQLAQQEKDNGALKAEVENLQTQLADVDTATFYRKQKQAVGLDDALKALQAGRPVEEKIGQLRQELSTWNSQKANFITGDAGRRIAADPQLVEQAFALLNAELPPAKRPDELQARLDGLLAGYRQALKSNATEFKLTPETINKVVALEKETNDLRDLVGRTSRGLAELAARGPDAPPAKAQTLQDALDTLQRRHDQERNEKVRAAMEKARLDGAALEAQAKADAKRKVDAAEAQAKLLLGDQQASEIIAAAQAKKREQDRIRKEEQDKEMKLALQRDFGKEETKIRAVLDLFIAGGEGEKVRQDGKRGPASLSALEGFNALEDSDDGVRGLITFIARTYRPKDQTLAFVGGYGITARQRQMASTIQATLRKYGALLVEKKLLAP